MNAKNGKAPIIDGETIILHHPMGRHGANFYHYVEMPNSAHIQFHKNFGYKNFSYHSANMNIWEMFFAII